MNPSYMLAYILTTFVTVMVIVGVALIFGTPWWLGIPVGVALYALMLRLGIHLMENDNESQKL